MAKYFSLFAFLVFQFQFIGMGQRLPKMHAAPVQSGLAVP